MDNNTTIIRVDRLEKDVSKLQANDEEKNKILSRMDVSSGKAEVYQEQIMSNLASITASVAKTLDKATETENLAKNLKIVTDAQSVDITAIGAEVTAIKMLPAENATRTKWLVKAMVIGNIGAIIVILIKVVLGVFGF